MQRFQSDIGARSRTAPFALLFALCTSLLVMAVRGPVAQDWIPFRVAATLASAGHWQDIYPDSGALHLFDVPDAFRHAAHQDIGRDGAPAFPPDTLTAFLSPPPAAFLLAPVRNASWQTSMVSMRLALAVPLSLGLLLFGLACREPRAMRHWALVCVCAAPLLIYTVVSGQPSGWLAGAAVVSLLPASAWLDVMGGAALALAVLTKATPVVVAIGLCVIGRRRLGSSALLIAALAVALSWPFTRTTAWSEFFGIGSRVGQTVLTDWNNASVDAAFLRWSSDKADPLLRTPGHLALAVSWLLRMAFLVMAVWSATGSRGSPKRRVSALWIAWLAASPLLWLHYMTVLLPLLGSVSHRRAGIALVCAGLLSAPLILRLTGASAMAVGHVGTVAWIASALCILWPDSTDALRRPAI